MFSNRLPNLSNQTKDSNCSVLFSAFFDLFVQVSVVFASGKEWADLYHGICEHCGLSASNSCPCHALDCIYEPSQILRLEIIQYKRIMFQIHIRHTAFVSHHDAFLQFSSLVYETWLRMALMVSDQAQCKHHHKVTFSLKDQWILCWVINTDCEYCVIRDKVKIIYI